MMTHNLILLTLEIKFLKFPIRWTLYKIANAMNGAKWFIIPIYAFVIGSYESEEPDATGTEGEADKGSFKSFDKEE